MIEPIEKGIMRKSVNKAISRTHIKFQCQFFHVTLRRRNDENYSCQKCLEISFNKKIENAENKEFVPLLDFEKLIPKNKKLLPLKEADSLI